MVLGVAYKKDTSDVRESPALDVFRLLQDRGAKIAYHDPYVAEVRLDGGRRQKAVPLTPANLKKADLVIILTDHSNYDYDLIVRHAGMVLDSRNATRNVKTGRSKIHKL